MRDLSCKKFKRGFAVFLGVFLVLTAMFGVILNITFLSFLQTRILRNATGSLHAYYLAEAGAEDALLRLKNSFDPSAFSYSLNVGTGAADIDVSNVVGGSRTIIAEGSWSNIIRKIQIAYSIKADKVSFHYGAQVGDGGMVMGNNARIKGNVFSNGNVTAPGLGYIDNSITVAQNGNKISGLKVGGDASVHTCESSDIAGKLTYVSGGSTINCTSGEAIGTIPNEIDPEPLPISLAEVNDWKLSAVGGGVISNDYDVSGGPVSLGPVQIGTASNPKNLTVNNGSHLRLTGTIYVTGNVIFENNSMADLDLTAYGFLSGIIIADGTVTVNNGVALSGSGQPGSYILILSTNSNLSPADPAIYVGNNAQGAIFYTTSGLIFLKNNMKVREVTGYKVQIENNAEVEYESGLQNANFSSGPGGSWQVTRWEEVE